MGTVRCVPAVITQTAKVGSYIDWYDLSKIVTDNDDPCYCTYPNGVSPLYTENIILTDLGYTMPANSIITDITLNIKSKIQYGRHPCRLVEYELMYNNDYWIGHEESHNITLIDYTDYQTENIPYTETTRTLDEITEAEAEDDTFGITLRYWFGGNPFQWMNPEIFKIDDISIDITSEALPAKGIWRNSQLGNIGISTSGILGAK